MNLSIWGLSGEKRPRQRADFVGPSSKNQTHFSSRKWECDVTLVQTTGLLEKDHNQILSLQAFFPSAWRLFWNCKHIQKSTRINVQVKTAYLITEVGGFLVLVPKPACHRAINLLHDPLVGFLLADCIAARSSTERNLLYGARALLVAEKTIIFCLCVLTLCLVSSRLVFTTIRRSVCLPANILAKSRKCALVI